MASIKMNEYRLTFQDGSEILGIRANMADVVKDFEDTANPPVNPLAQVQKTRGSLDVAIPDLSIPVHFTIRVTPQAAVDADCRASPSAFTVLDGTAVVFEALPGAGFDFTGWFLDAPMTEEDATTFDPTIPVSTDMISVMVVTSPGAGLERHIEARFAPTTP